MSEIFVDHDIKNYNDESSDYDIDLIEQLDHLSYEELIKIIGKNILKLSSFNRDQLCDFILEKGLM